MDGQTAQFRPLQKFRGFCLFCFSLFAIEKGHIYANMKFNYLTCLFLSLSLSHTHTQTCTHACTDTPTTMFLHIRRQQVQPLLTGFFFFLPSIMHLFSPAERSAVVICPPQPHQQCRENLPKSTERRGWWLQCLLPWSPSSQTT